MRTVPRSGLSTLSPRQAEIAELLRSGRSSRDIGALLGIDSRTVDVHVSAICNKLGVRTRVEIVNFLAHATKPEVRAEPDAPPAERAPRRTNLPLQVSSFVGREFEIAEITSLLGRHRLVTLTGSGGVGKTRTSLQVAAGTRGNEDGVWFIELAPLVDGEYLPTTIAQGLGVTLGANGDPIDQLVAVLKSKNTLLVLDNCEHLVDACARIVSALITGCPRITILASSRQALGIVGEATYRIPSLPVPPATAAAPRGTIRAHVAVQFAAVALFVERAQAVSSRFELTDANAPSVTDICRRLDGIALAIELAAAWVKMLSPQQLQARLDDRFRLLTSGGRDRLPRHQTLRALIDWSHDRLDEREQRLLRRLSVFANGFTLEAASAIGGADEFDDFEVFNLVASLVEKSLVMADPNGDALRYHLLESTRAYAAEKLVEAGEREALASRHLRYFRDRFVESRCKHEQLVPGIEALFVRELDDLRVALDGALIGREFVDGAELMLAIGAVCWTSGGLGCEGIARCEAFSSKLQGSDSRLSGGLGVLLTSILSNTGRFTQARETGLAAIEHARASGDGPILAEALCVYAFAHLFNRNFLAAAGLLGEADAIQGVSPLCRLRLLECRGHLSMEMGDFDSAALTFAQVREAFRSAGFPRCVAALTVQLADVESRRRQYHRAAELACEAVLLARTDDSSADLPYFLVFLGQVRAVSGELLAAIDPAIEAIMLVAHRAPGHFAVTLAIELLAYIAAARGDAERSARLAGYADAGLVRIGFSRDDVPRALYDGLRARLQDCLTSDELARLTAEGASLTPHSAIALTRAFETSRDD